MKKIFIVCVMAVFLCACGSSSSYVFLEDREVTTGEASSSFESKEETQTVSLGKCVVYICGAVVSPGVYEVDSGSRVVDVLDLAGGISTDGDPTVINLAEPVYDGEQIYIPTFDEVSSGYSTSKESYKETQSLRVNINTASKEELMTIKGIGEGKALAIIEYRQKNGGFSSVEELVNVRGIGEASLERLRDYITVN